MIILTILFNALGVWLGAKLLRGVTVNDFIHAVIIGLVVAVLNATLGSILDFIPLFIWTLCIDALMLMIADYFLKGLTIKNFWWALALAFIIAVINGVAHKVF